MCSGACKTSVCACRAAKILCTAECAKHKSATCKCNNKGDADFAVPGTARAAGAGGKRGAKRQRICQSDDESDGDVMDSEDNDSDQGGNESDGGNMDSDDNDSEQDDPRDAVALAEARRAARFKGADVDVPVSTRPAKEEDLVVGAKVHCNWPVNLMFYRGQVEAVSVLPGPSTRKPVTQYIIRYDPFSGEDQGTEAVTDIRKLRVEKRG